MTKQDKHSRAAHTSYRDQRTSEHKPKKIKVRGRSITMPKTDDRAVRLYIDFPYVEALLQFRNFLRDEWAISGEEEKLHLFKIDFLIEGDVPTGNKYIVKYKNSAPEEMMLTTQIIADTYYSGDITAVEGHRPNR